MLGEVDKIVPVSRHRFRQLRENGDTLEASVAVASGETVVVWAMTPNQTNSIFSALTNVDSGNVPKDRFEVIIILLSKFTWIKLANERFEFGR